MTLLNTVNETMINEITESKIVTKNLELLSEYLNMSGAQLNEAATAWLANVRNLVSNGKLNPAKKEKVVKILAVLSALSNSDLAQQLDTKNDLGSVLYNAGGKDESASASALNRLMALSSNDLVGSFMASASKAVEDTNTINDYTKQIQINIDRIMTKKLGVERAKNKGFPMLKASQTD